MDDLVEVRSPRVMAAAVLSLVAAALFIVATVVEASILSRALSGTAALLLAVSGGMNLQKLR